MPTAVDLQHHLYNSLLEQRAPDVTLRISGWNALYRLHRVVLIQAGFFKVAFTGGYTEDRSSIIDIAFDDVNITRPAFEICISRLYGGGPPLHIMLDPNEQAPADHQPTTPSLLLSLLATSVYLDIPSIAYEAVSTILRTVDERTVIDYLNFSLGRPLTSPMTKSAVGLENVAEADETAGTIYSIDSAASIKVRDDSPSHFEEQYKGLQFRYGTISDKIGETCACWLARWGADFFERESHSTSDETLGVWSRLSARWIRALFSSSSLYVEDEYRRWNLAKDVVEYRRGLSTANESEEVEWAALFEEGIYYCHMPMKDLIVIAETISPTTHKPFVPLRVIQRAFWDQGILRLKVVEASSVSDDVDKELGLSAPFSEIQAVNDDSRAFYQVPRDTSFRLGDVALGIRDETIGKVSQTDKSRPEKAAELTLDELFKACATKHCGAGADSFFGLEPRASVVVIPPIARLDRGKGKARAVEDADSGLAVPNEKNAVAGYTPYPPLRFAVEFHDLHLLQGDKRLYSRTVWYAGSLFNVYVQVSSSMSSKQAPQLGIYVHRHSNIEPIPRASALRPPFSAMMPGNMGSEVSLRSPTNQHPLSASSSVESSRENASGTSPTSVPIARHRNVSTSSSPVSPIPSSPPRGHWRSLTRTSTNPTQSAATRSSPSTLHGQRSTSSLNAAIGRGAGVLAHYEQSAGRRPSVDEPKVNAPYTAPPVTTEHQPYRDPRKVVMAYFGIFCHVGGSDRADAPRLEMVGPGQVRFASAPDHFKVLQSWGWKTRDLNVNVGANGGDSTPGTRRSNTLRASVVLGLV